MFDLSLLGHIGTVFIDIGKLKGKADLEFCIKHTNSEMLIIYPGGYSCMNLEFRGEVVVADTNWETSA